METDLDKIEAGAVAWKDLLREYYKDFDANLNNAEIQLEGKHLKVPDEESDEVCPNCGRKLVYKNGRFGRFLACPGYPECSFTMPIVVEMPGKCPACGGRLLKRTSRKALPTTPVSAGMIARDMARVRAARASGSSTGNTPGCRIRTSTSRCSASMRSMIGRRSTG